VLVVEIESADPRGIDIAVELSSPLRVIEERLTDEGATLLLRMPSDVAPSHDVHEQPVRYSEDPCDAMEGAVVVHVQREARTVRVYLATETTFSGIGRNPVGKAADAAVRAADRVVLATELGASAIYARHIVDHGRLYSRVELDTGVSPDRPTDDRITSQRHPLDADPSLAALLFHYGRYLLICSSREGGVPANLQGIWNDSLQPAWSSNYTTNINLEMNYWMAEAGNLAECLPPLFDLIDGLAVTGAATARQLYDAPGWVAHHNTDVWAYSQPVGLGGHDPKWSFWPLAGAWLVRHLWERILHGADDGFVRDRAWAPIRGAAEFYLSWLVEMSDGSLSTVPSTSPENQFVTADGVIGSSAVSSTNDLLAIADLFEIVGAVASRLGLECDPVARAAASARRRLPGLRISATGAVQEWLEDLDFPDPQHRHVSQLYFLHPLDWPIDEKLHAAASRTLDLRGDESTGWSLAWKLIMRARLGQPGKVSDLMRLFFRDMAVDRGPWVGGLYPNLMAAHPPFSIDGNFGFVTGLAECLMQSHAGHIELLPAVPPELASGSVHGLVARPGIEVSLSWTWDAGAARLVDATFTAVTAAATGRHMVRCAGARLELGLELGVPVTLDAAEFARAEPCDLAG
jgi:alpha-L-fucosidase 2